MRDMGPILAKIKVLEKDNEMLEELVSEQSKEIDTLGDIVSALDGHDTTFLWQIRTKLKQEFGGEGWAVGEMIERAVKKLGNEKFVIQIKGESR